MTNLISSTRPVPPPRLAQNIFLICDHEKAQLAYEVSRELEKIDPEAVSWNFLEPIYEALGSFVDIEFNTNMSDPSMNPHGDACLALIKWTEDFFGEAFLATKALNEHQEAREFGNEETIIFRDATWKYVEPFISSLKPHEVLFVDLVGAPSKLDSEKIKTFASRWIITASSDPAAIAKLIVEASK